MANPKYLNMTVAQVEQAFGKDGKAAYDALVEANRIAGEKRKALTAIVGKTVTAPAGKSLKVRAQWGKLSISFDDAKADGDRPKQSLAEWLSAQNG